MRDYRLPVVVVVVVLNYLASERSTRSFFFSTVTISTFNAARLAIRFVTRHSMSMRGEMAAAASKRAAFKYGATSRLGGTSLPYVPDISVRKIQHGNRYVDRCCCVASRDR